MQANESRKELNVAQCEVSLKLNGYLVVDRHPEVKIGIPGKFMVYDPHDDEEGYCIVGDDRNQLVLDAYEHLEVTLGRVSQSEEFCKDNICISLLDSLRKIADISANSNSEPDVMGAALEKSQDIAAMAIKNYQSYACKVLSAV